MMKRFKNRKVILGTAIGAAAILLIALLAVFYEGSDEKNSLSAYAEDVIDICADANSRQSCYDIEIPKLANEGLTLEQSFDVIRLVQARDDGYFFCHAGAHKISANEYYRDPDRWSEVMTRCPVGMCSNGCLHGTLQERFSSASLNGAQLAELLPDLENICEPRDNWVPTEQERASCYHEIGHLSMYLTGGDVQKSGGVCETLAVRPGGEDFRQTCYEGIFMQVFEPREPDDFALIYDIVPDRAKLVECEQYQPGVEKGACWTKGWKEGYKSFCDQFTGGLRSACFREAWVVESAELALGGNGIIEFCSYSDDSAEKRKCYNTLFYGLMATFHFDVDRMKPICAALPRGIMDQCFANTASRLIETDHSLVDESVEICRYAESLGVGESCYEELVHYGGFVFAADSTDLAALCSSLPDTWSEKCLLNEKK